MPMRALLLLAALTLALVAALAPATGPRLAVTPAADDAGIRREADALDALIDACLAKRGVAPAAELDADAFCRRAHLDLAGRIPTAAELAAWRADTAPGRELRLVRRLVGSDAWVAAEFVRLADLLRLETRLPQQQSGQPYIDHLKQALRDNTPWDALVRGLLLAEGSPYAPGNGATGFWLRDNGMPLDHLAAATRAFLHTSISCAQCHDHPYDRWTRADFYHLAAYTNGVRITGDQARLRALRQRLGVPEGTAERQAQQQTLNELRALTTTVRPPAAPKPIALPADWKGDGHRPGDLLTAKPLAGEAGPDRAAFASWMTTTPRFALTAADRLWRDRFGAPLVADNGWEADAAPGPDAAVAEHAAALFRRLGHDVQAFTIVLASTRHYRRAASADALAAGVRAGPPARRLTAAQLWDSLAVLADPGVDARRGRDASALTAFWQQHHDADADALLTLARGMADTRARERAVQQAERALRERIKAGAPPAEVQAERARIAMLREQLGDDVNPLDGARRQHRNRGDDVLRAAELPQPAPAGHPLRTFGQGDRQTIDGSRTDSTVPQALFLMNSVIDQRILAPAAPLRAALSGSAEDRIALLFRTILSREPTAAEVERWRSVVAAAPATGATDLGWALINSRAFVTAP